jgi:iron complex transport system substrate-binding protein
LNGMKSKLYLVISGLTVVLAGVLLLSMERNREKEKAAASKSAGLRIVSLAPNVTEMLFALGLGDSLIGVTNYCDYPAAAKTITHVGGFIPPNIEKILDLHPDLVVVADFKRQDALALLRGSGIRTLNLTINSFDDMFVAFRQLGQATNHSRAAENLVSQMQAELRAIPIKYRFADLPENRRPKVFVEIWSDPVTTVGRGSIIDELIRCAGGVNVAADLPGMYPKISPEQMIAWNPDDVFVCYMNSQAKLGARMASRIGWKDISAVKQNRIYGDIPRDLILRPGPRMIQGVKLLAERLYGAPKP